jgi:hypothetical protein
MTLRFLSFKKSKLVEKPPETQGYLNRPASPPVRAPYMIRRVRSWVVAEGERPLGSGLPIIFPRLARVTELDFVILLF